MNNIGAYLALVGFGGYSLLSYKTGDFPGALIGIGGVYWVLAAIRGRSE